MSQNIEHWRRQNQNSSPLCKSGSSLGTATKSTRRSLPKSPRKWSVDVRKLFDKYSNETNSPKSVNSEKISSTALSCKTAEFYLRDDVSRQAPGLKDVTVLKEYGVKLKMQTRYLYTQLFKKHMQRSKQSIKMSKQERVSLVNCTQALSK